jgi:hypothetical protein
MQGVRAQFDAEVVRYTRLCQLGRSVDRLTMVRIGWCWQLHVCVRAH